MLTRPTGKGILRITTNLNARLNLQIQTGDNNAMRVTPELSVICSVEIYRSRSSPSWNRLLSFSGIDNGSKESQQ